MFDDGKSDAYNYTIIKPRTLCAKNLQWELSVKDTKVKQARTGERPGAVELIQSYLMVAGTVIGIFVFVAIPLAWVIRYGMVKYKGYGKVKYVFLENIVKVFQDSVYWKSVLNTFVFAIGKLLVEIPLALVTAFILTRKIKFRNFFRAMYFMPSMISVAIMGVVFSYLFAHNTGVVNEIIKFFLRHVVMAQYVAGARHVVLFRKDFHAHADGRIHLAELRSEHAVLHDRSAEYRSCHV